MTSFSTSPPAYTDVLIMGGGLAGLSLAIQIKQCLPDKSVVVIERRQHPVPLAAHKVGESTVEIGAHYFAQILGLKDHLETAHLKKFGFRFFFSEGRRDLDAVTEIGASRYLSVPSYQLDRGLFENYLAQRAQALGVQFFDGAKVQHVALHDAPGASPHNVQWQHGEHAPTHTQAHWVIDACGRAGLLKRKLQLAQDNAHRAGAVWFRIKGHLDVDQWGASAQWKQRCTPQARWLSTNHLVGAGYWVWLIPLSSGHHSVGIVADPRWHPLSSMDTFAKTMQWFQTYQPLLFDALQGREADVVDFAYFRHFSYGCKQVFSSHRWALTGEAGLFLDPFYSPGSDFIAISNTYITALITRESQGHSIGAHAQLFDQTYHSFYDSTMALYQDQYGLFGDPQVLPLKVLWDYSYYWGVLAQLFFQQRLCDFTALSDLRAELHHCQTLNATVQSFLRAWSEVSSKDNPAQMLDQASLPWFAKLNSSLHDHLDDAAFRARMRQSTCQLHDLAKQLLHCAQAQHPELAQHALAACLAAPSAQAFGQPFTDEDTAPQLWPVQGYAPGRLSAHANAHAMTSS